MQKQLNFDSNHGQENNPQSDAIYTNNLDALNNNCKIIFKELLTGKKLSGIDIINLGIIEYRKRFDDLKKVYKIPVKDELVEGKRYKCWYLEKLFINQYLNQN